MNLVPCALLSQLIDVFRPAILHFFVPRSHPVQLPTSPDEPLDASSSLPPTAPAHDPAPLHTPGVDLGIARASLVLQAICFVIIAVSKDAGMYVAGSALGALAAGYAPTMQSLSLELYTRRGGAPSEAGRLFGAMSVIQTIGCVHHAILAGLAMTLTECCTETRLSAHRCLALYTSRRSPRSQRRFFTLLWSWCYSRSSSSSSCESLLTQEPQMRK
jgi:hypothetical protein